MPPDADMVACTRPEDLIKYGLVVDPFRAFTGGRDIDDYANSSARLYDCSMTESDGLPATGNGTTKACCFDIRNSCSVRCLNCQHSKAISAPNASP